jgi:hypothetical protein
MRVTNGIPLGCPLLLPVRTVNSVATLKVLAGGEVVERVRLTMNSAATLMTSHTTEGTGDVGHASQQVRYGTRFHPEFCRVRVRITDLCGTVHVFETGIFTRGCHWITRLCSSA